MPNTNNYGKLINGEFYPAPNPVLCDGKWFGNPPEEVLTRLGYKKVIFAGVGPDLTGKKPYCVWTEKDDYIEQKIEGNDPPTALGVQLRSALSYTQSQLHTVKLSVERIHEYENLLLEHMRHLTPESGIVFDYYAPKTPNGTVDEVAARLFTTNEKHQIELTEEGKSILQNPDIHLGKRDDYYKDDSLYCWHILVQLSFVQQHRDNLEGVSYRMSLCYLYSLLNDFISKVICTNLMIHPETATHKLEVSAISELLTITDFDALKEKLISTEIAQIPFGYYEKYKYLEKILNFNTHPKRKDFRDDIIILCEERHVLIHRGGIIDQKFLDVAKTTMYSRKYDIGDSVIVTHDYIKKMIALVEELCCALFDTIASNNPIYF